jgi:hypothetical protein
MAVAAGRQGTPWRVFSNEVRKRPSKEHEESLSDLQTACRSMFLAQVMRKANAGDGQDEWFGTDDAHLTDMEFVLPDGTRIRGHKGFLSARSAYIRAVFASGMQESKTGALKVKIFSFRSENQFLRRV